MPGEMSTSQHRCVYLAARCYTGFSKDDKEKKKPIPEGKALEEWKELLEKRFPQPNSGGKPFVLQIVDMVKNKKTHAGLDLTDKNAILEHLAEWCERMCKEHGIDPGSEALQALRQQQQWYEDLKHDNSETHGMLEEQDSRCDRLFEEPMPQWGRCLHDCALCRRACPYGKQKAMVSS